MMTLIVMDIDGIGVIGGCFWQFKQFEFCLSRINLSETLIFHINSGPIIHSQHREQIDEENIAPDAVSFAYRSRYFKRSSAAYPCSLA